MKNELIDLATIKKKRQREICSSNNSFVHDGENRQDWFFGHSQIATLNGILCVRELKEGDLLLTRDRGFQPLVAIKKLITSQTEYVNISSFPVKWHQNIKQTETEFCEGNTDHSTSVAYRLACSQGEMIMCDNVWVGCGFIHISENHEDIASTAGGCIGYASKISLHQI